MLRELQTSLRLFVALTILLGVLYPLTVTGLAALLFPEQAGGSLIPGEPDPSGSLLIGQPFSDPRFFWGRPSSTPEIPYNARSSSGSNLAPSNPALRKDVAERIQALKDSGLDTRKPVPVDLVTASGSGLDPHISVAAALYQIPRIARLRGIPEERLRDLVKKHTEGRTWGILGEPRVNVLSLNLALERENSPVS